MPPSPQIFLSYASADAVVADLFKFAMEHLLDDLNVQVWNYRHDQLRNERSVGASLRSHIQESAALVFIMSEFTLKSGATQWMELAYADAFKVPTFVLLYRITFEDLIRQETGVPPLVLAGQCTPAINWQSLKPDLRRCCTVNKGSSKEDDSLSSSEDAGKP